MAYKISGTSSDNARIYVLQNSELVGYKDNNYGNYEVNFESSTPSGITVVSENPDGQVVGFGGLVALSTGDSSNIIPVGGTIVSIQMGSVSVGGVSSANTAISAVDVSKTMLIWNGNKGGSSIAANRIYAELTSSTNVRATHANTGSASLYFTVVEFGSGINSIQRGTVTINASAYSGTDTITDVNTSKTFVNLIGWSTASSSFDGDVSIDLLDSTTVRLRRDATSGSNVVASYEIIEFD